MARATDVGLLRPCQNDIKRPGKVDEEALPTAVAEGRRAPHRIPHRSGVGSSYRAGVTLPPSTPKHEEGHNYPDHLQDSSVHTGWLGQDSPKASILAGRCMTCENVV